MRITGGKARGIELRVPRVGGRVRPATDRMREAVFSSLGPSIRGKRVADLFSGSGSYGLEAVSREASDVCFVDRDWKCIQAVSGNLEAVLKATGDLRVHTIVRTEEVFRWCARTAQRFDLVFLDPPYEMATLKRERLMQAILGILVSEKHSRVVFELPGDLNFCPEGWNLLRRLGKRRGRADPGVSIFSVKEG